MEARPAGFSRRSLLGAAAAGGVYALTAAAFGRVTAQAEETTSVPAHVLWFDEPATLWQEHAFPVGNGSAGAMIFGGVNSEHIQFNHDTLWNGGPGSVDDGHDYNWGNWYEERPTALSDVRATIEKDGSADVVAAMKLLGQTKWGYGAYQTFGDLYLDRPSPSGTVSGYRRDLDMATGIASVAFTADGVNFRREFFASYPDRVIVSRLTADKAGQISFTARFDTPDNRTVAYSAQEGRITMRGALTHNGMVFEAQVQVLAEGGSLTSNANGTVTVTGANAATLLLTLGTNYANSYPTYRGADPHDAVTAALNAVAHRRYDEIRARHVTDHSGLFNRVSIDIGQQPTTLPTDEALQAFKNLRSTQGKVPADPQLEMLHFQIGRYLLIGSSRPGSMPANLQGVWNDSVSPDWQSDYTTNINLEMNYWPSDLTNLPETVPPLADFIESLREPGRVTARKLLGAGGFATMNHINVFGYSGVSTNASTWSPESTAWLIRQLWEHYLFTQDREFLRTRAYPILREHTEFWLDYLMVDKRDGTLVVTPSFSPEEGPFTAGCSYSQMIIWDLFTNTIEAAKVLGIDDAYRTKLEATKAKLDPGLRIGSWGQLQEWKADLDEQDNGHRHMSHSYALFPGNQITAEGTPEYFEAARVTVETRTAHTAQNDIGWNRAQKVNLFARLHNGNMAREQVDHLLWRNTFPNFLNDWPFQIDGNFGVTAGIAEMLLQSHAGFVDVLPALPDGWAQGSYDGLRARGAFTVGASWRDKVPYEIRVSSDAGGPLRLHSPMLNGNVRMESDPGPVPRYDASGGVLTLDTLPHHRYRIWTVR
ncbi:glycoside hydrolase family 95 protein [Amycolatopsis sp. K13G38]|uniref:Glycoside hydrolase family 95 protein n=1 Tax=Amycolatopsis acididurans TaxID=2724524 RepID=A0ABX1JB40_9PSEU|nr:glycoside hydrolase family 95 protein [Amycolatopsis acididurans]NKQ56903.1 glycoside hydrolase family 95 protein [Amycolatopsis acididurans]